MNVKRKEEHKLRCRSAEGGHWQEPTIDTKSRDVFRLAPRVFKSAVLEQCAFCATEREACTEANKKTVRSVSKVKRLVMAFSYFVSGPLG